MDTERKVDSCMENPWEVLLPCCFTRKILLSGMVPFSSLPCVRSHVSSLSHQVNNLLSKNVSNLILTRCVRVCVCMSRYQKRLNHIQ